jgi:hypothetical protein
MMHKSLATIESPEFINLQPLEINPLMSSCEIKVLYLGENRNHSYITKEVATDMAKTLRGAPIVGYYKEEKEDFRDHGQQIIFDDEGVKFECLTKPYGFVAPDAQVWFQKFEEKDDFGNSIIREYLMTTGYLWTGQYEEAELAVKQGRPQSMELDEDTLDGRWSVNNKTGMEFFIINDAIFSKLCILGEDVEPCFEGASVTAPEVSKNFSLDDNFKRTLFTMMQDLKFALEGGKNMEIVVENTEEIVTEETVVENIETAVEAEEVATEEESVEETPATEFDSLKRAEKVVEAPAAVEETEEKVEEQPEEEVAPVEEEISEPEVTEEEVVEEIPAEDDNSEQSIEVESEEVIEATQSSQENFAKSEEDKKEEEAEEEDSESESEEEKEDDKEEEDEKKKYSLLEAELEKANTAYAELEEKYNALVEFKNAVENKEKEELINSFYMLSDEDKKDVIENKSNYSLDEIEAKLSVICVRKKVNFDLDDSSKNDNIVEEKVTTYNISEAEATSTPAWITALKNTRDNK